MESLEQLRKQAANQPPLSSVPAGWKSYRRQVTPIRAVEQENRAHSHYSTSEGTRKVGYVIRQDIHRTRIITNARHQDAFVGPFQEEAQACASHCRYRTGGRFPLLK